MKKHLHFLVWAPYWALSLFVSCSTPQEYGFGPGQGGTPHQAREMGLLGSEEAAAPIPTLKKLLQQHNLPAAEIEEFLQLTPEELLIGASSRAGALDVVAYLIQAGANVNARDEDGCTPLMHAARAGLLEIVNALLTAGANVNAQDNRGNTALKLAAVYGGLIIVDRLIEAEANVHAQDNHRRTALMHAAGALWFDIMTGHIAAGGESIDILNALLKAEANVHAQDDEGRTALMHAASAGLLDIVNALITAEANVHAQDDEGRTALMHAASAGSIAACMSALLKAQANVHAQDNRGNTALMLAAGHGSIIIVDRLIAETANVNAQANDGGTALMKAAFWLRPNVVDHLLAAGANPELLKEDGCTALLVAISSPAPQMWKGVREEPVAWRDDYHDKAEAEAARVRIIKSLMQRGTSLKVRDPAGNTALLLAAENCGNDVIDMLLLSYGDARDKDVEVRNNLGSTPLIRAVWYGNTKVAEHLLKTYKADVNARSPQTETPLMLAIEGLGSAEEKIEMIKLLIQNGAKLKAADANHRTALDKASTGAAWYGREAQIVYQALQAEIKRSRSKA